MRLTQIMLAITCAALVFLTGCSSIVGHTYDDVKVEAEDRISVAKSSVTPEPELSNVRVRDTFYVPDVKPKDAQKPAWYFIEETGRFNDISLETSMREVLGAKGVNVRFLDGVSRDIKFSLNHKGSIGELLDKISFATKYSYVLDGDMLTWSRFETAELPLKFLSGQTNYFFGGKDGANRVNDQGMTGGQQVVVDTNYSNSEEYVNFSTSDLNIWKEVEDTIKMFMSGDEGAQVRINQGSSTVIVRDYPDNVAQIRRHINSLNHKLTRMVVVDIQIVELTSNVGDKRGLNWDVIKQDLASGGILNFASNFNSLTSDNLAPTVLGWTQETGKYAGSSALINALNTYGVQTKTTTRRLTGLNNQVTRVVNGGEFFFLAKSGSSATPNVGSEDSLTPGILKLGETVYMLPNAVDDDIVIQLSTRMSSLRGEEPRRVTSGSKAIEAPETKSDESFMKFAIKDGETILVESISGDEQLYTENSTLGTIALGGEKGGSTNKRERLVLITPRIVGRN